MCRCPYWYFYGIPVCQFAGIIFLLDFDTGMTKIRAAPIPGIGIRPISAFFDGIGIGQVCYTSTNFCYLCIIIHKIVFSKSRQAK